MRASTFPAGRVERFSLNNTTQKQTQKKYSTSAHQSSVGKIKQKKNTFQSHNAESERVS